MSPGQVNCQYYVSGQLKSNVQSRLDYLSGVFINLSEHVQKYDSENRQMKEFITILLHFKYMLQFLRSNLIRDDELFKRLGPDAAILFKTDLKQCMAKFNQVIESSQCFDFVAEKNDYYQLNGAYCSYNEEDILCLKPKKSRSELASSNAAKQGLAHNSNNVASADHEKDNNENEHYFQIKMEPDVEIIELARTPRETNDSIHSSDDSRNDSRSNNQQHQPQHSAANTLIEKSSSSSSSTSNHKIREKSNNNNNDLKLTIITTPQSSRKMVKRPPPNYPETPDEMPSTSKAESNSNKKPKSAKSNLFAFERQHSQDEDYDFDYEKEDYDFDEDEYVRINACQLRCPQNGCSSVFDSEMELNEHLSSVHFNMMDLVVPTYDCLVEGCNQKFPNLARANVHMKNSHPDAYITCEQCQKQVKAHYLRKHVYMRHRKGEYKCSQDCGYVAEYYHELEKHRYMIHRSQLSAAEFATFIAHNSEDMQVPARIRRFNCKFNDCNFSHESRNRTLKHIRMHHLGQSSRNGLPVGNPAEDRAALEYLDVVEFPDSSFLFAD